MSGGRSKFGRHQPPGGFRASLERPSSKGYTPGASPAFKDEVKIDRASKEGCKVEARKVKRETRRVWCPGKQEKITLQRH